MCLKSRFGSDKKVEGERVALARDWERCQEPELVGLSQKKKMGPWLSALMPTARGHSILPLPRYLITASPKNC
jgi:hypothetical protein